jgi:RHS repeat-associated protein
VYKRTFGDDGDGGRVAEVKRLAATCHGTDQVTPDNVAGAGVSASSSVTSYFIRLPNGTLLGEHIASGTYAGYYYYLTDGNGSVVDLVDSSGNVKDTYSYDPYGNATTTGSVPNPFRFDGAVWDSSSGLYKMGTRYYDPVTRRWTQMDVFPGVLSDPMSQNRYAFVEGPARTEPTGRQSFLLCLDAWLSRVARSGASRRR